MRHRKSCTTFSGLGSTSNSQRTTILLRMRSQQWLLWGQVTTKEIFFLFFFSVWRITNYLCFIQDTIALWFLDSISLSMFSKRTWIFSAKEKSVYLWSEFLSFLWKDQNARLVYFCTSCVHLNTHLSVYIRYSFIPHKALWNIIYYCCQSTDCKCFI